MINRELLAIRSKWEELGNLTGFTFLMELRRNKKLIEQGIKKLETIRADTPDYIKFREEYLELRKSYADLDSNGNPIVVPVQGNNNARTYKVTEKIAEFAPEEKLLIEKYKPALDEMEVKNDKYDEALNKTCHINFYTVSESLIPKTITNAQLDTIEFMVQMGTDLTILKAESPNLKDLYESNKSAFKTLGIKAYKELLKFNSLTQMLSTK